MLIELTLREKQEIVFINYHAIMAMKTAWEAGKPVGADLFIGYEKFCVTELPMEILEKGRGSKSLEEIARSKGVENVRCHESIDEERARLRAERLEREKRVAAQEIDVSLGSRVSKALQEARAKKEKEADDV